MAKRTRLKFPVSAGWSIAILSLTSVPVFSSQVTGTVVDERGAPIAGASVWSEGGRTETNSAGEFVLTVDASYPEGERTVRVSAPGRTPLTRLGPSRVAQPFVLRRSATATWTLPRCTGAVSRTPTRGFIKGFALRMRVPNNLEVRAPVDTETVRRQVCRGPECLTYTTGGMRSSAEWVGSLALKGAMDIRERDLRNPVSDAVLDRGVEYRVSRTDGTRTRFVSFLSEWIAYERVSAPSALVFDRIIDTLCALPIRD